MGDAVLGGRAKSFALREKSALWHAADFTRNFALPAIGAAYVIWDVARGGASAFDWALFVSLLFLTSLGMSVGLHRLFSHNAFVPAPWLNYTLAVLGSMTWQRPLFQWVVRHKFHHMMADRPGDYHSPHFTNEGQALRHPLLKFLHAHYAWLHLSDVDVDAYPQLTRKLRADPGLVLINKWYDAIALGSILLPALSGAAFYGTWAGFVDGLMWGGLARIFVLLHLTWMVNSLGHLIGERGYETHDKSTNVPILGYLLVGEGYHNNHHAFPASPTLAVDPGQFDLGWTMIKLMHKFGWVKSFKSPPTAEQRAMKRAELAGQAPSTDLEAAS